MGSGIAETCARSGFASLLFDPSQDALNKAREHIRTNLELLRDRQKISASEVEEIMGRIRFSTDPGDCMGDIVIEAIIEDMGAKRKLFADLSKINPPETILASNTSSLSLSEISAGLDGASRFCGLHFFNPAPVMKLVEIVQTAETSAEVIQRAYDFITALGKTSVLCKDSPGFIVNRVARHYYLEALQLVEDGVGDFAQVDRLLENAGFRMGPFKLMDLIGNDINFTVTRSLYEAFDRAARFQPSAIQEEKIRNGELGRKSGKGYFTY
jgi:3-hydroxybutyryl-CoA dehydrogenase